MEVDSVDSDEMPSQKIDIWAEGTKKFMQQEWEKIFQKQQADAQQQAQQPKLGENLAKMMDEQNRAQEQANK